MLKKTRTDNKTLKPGITRHNWQCAWITGASSGVGRHLSLKLAEQGVRVAATARDPHKLADLAACHPNITPYPLDVTDPNAVTRTANLIHDEIGPIDLAVLNAGVFQAADPLEFSASDATACMQTNYQGVANCVEPLIKLMVPRSTGHIAIMGSVAGYRGLPDCATYGPTKAALINLAEALYLGLRPQGIMVSIINPGYIDTPMTEKNTFEMPFIVEVEDAANRILNGLVKRRYEIAFPGRLVAALKFGRMMRNHGYFRYARWFLVTRNPRLTPPASETTSTQEQSATRSSKAK